MPHFKCAACRIRLYSLAATTDPVGDLCPGCGSLLEPVGALSEVVGFRSITRRSSAADASASADDQRIADQIGNLLALRAAIRAQARLDAERRTDDGGRFAAKAIPLRRPKTTR